MKVVVCTGTPWTGLEQVGTVLKAAGIQPPINPVRGQATIESFHAQLEKVGQADNRSSFIGQPVHPGKIWGQQALGILQDNLNQQVWGWTNSFSTWLLDFWQSLDQNIYFVLVYSTPEEDFARFMQHEEGPLSEIAADQWLSINTQLLRFYNRNRERCLLVNRNAGLSDSSDLLNLCNDRFALSLQVDVPSIDSEHQEPDTIGCVLAQCFLKDRADVYNLYREIQATATQPAEDESPDLIDSAWSAYQDLSLKVTQQRQQYTDALTKQERQLREQSTELEQCREEHELLLLQLHQVQEELESTFLDSQKKQADSANQQAELKKQLEASGKKVDQYKKKIETLQKEMSAFVEGQGHNASELELLRDKSREMEQENELLLLQLHQVQEELEHYFLLYQESQAKQEEQAAQVQSDGRIKLFMSGLSSEENWYPVEEVEGKPLRWSGPEPRATLRLPVKRDKDQLLVIHYEQVVAPEQLKGLHFEVDGEQVNHNVYDTLSQKYVVVQLPATPEPHSLEIELAIVLSKMVKPCDVAAESPDDRPLGIAVYSLSILPVTPRLRINWPDTSYRRLQLKRKISRIGGGIETFPLAYFDGKTYLQEYPDVAEAVRQGTVASALIHYVQHGYYDGHDFMLADTHLPSEGDENDLIRIERP